MGKGILLALIAELYYIDPSFCINKKIFIKKKSERYYIFNDKDIKSFRHLKVKINRQKQ